MQRRRLATAAALTLLAGAAVAARLEHEHGHVAEAAALTTCGVERWAVKTLTDAAARSIDWRRPRSRTIAQLAAVPNRSPAGRTAFERHVYRVTATIEAAKLEPDGDVHLVLRQGLRMIAELPATSCTRGAQQRYAIAQARAAFTRRFDVGSSSYRPIRARATLAGVGFLDRIHGQRGVAPNGVELHPVLALRWAS